MKPFKEEKFENIRIAYIDDTAGQYLILKVYGTYNPGYTQGAMGKGVSEMIELGYTKCLVDFRSAKHEMSTTEIFHRPDKAVDAKIPANF